MSNRHMPNPDAMVPEGAKFPIRLYCWMDKRGESMRTLAKKVGLTYTMIWRYTRGDAEPILSNLIKIADVLDVSIDELCGRAGKNEN